MKKILLIILAAIALTTYCHTENQIKISLKRNNKGEILLNITGHSNPIIIEMNNKTTTFDVNDKEINLDAVLDAEIEPVDTASGTEQSNIDNQIPPVMSNFNPPLATPY